MSPDDVRGLSRRTILSASGGALVAATTGRTAAEGDSSPAGWRRCPEATLEPSSEPCEGTTTAGCADAHPETVAIRTAVEETLASRYPTVGALVDDGYLPYFDTFDGGDDGWSHWLNPEYIGDDTVLEPERPGAVLVDNETWRPLGVMFVATRDGEPIEPPPVYGKGKSDDERCSPWHYHAGLPGRKAWWYYRTAYADDPPSLQLPCHTPCVMHVWTVEHPGGVYAHDAPPSEYRDEPAAAETGLETAAEPGEDVLGWATLPDAFVPAGRPPDFDSP